MTAADPLVSVPVRDVGSRGKLVVRFHTFASVDRKVQFLAGLVLEQSPRVRMLARTLGSIEAAHEFVRDAIAYENEEIERLETPSFVLKVREGDCDAKAVLLAALVREIGGAVELVPMGGTHDDPQHLGTRLLRRAEGVIAPVVAAPWEPLGRAAPPGRIWAETTVRAELGELPGDAARRLAPHRDDLR